jgi:hypothetical protein
MAYLGYLLERAWMEAGMGWVLLSRRDKIILDNPLDGIAYNHFSHYLSRTFALYDLISELSARRYGIR